MSATGDDLDEAFEKAKRVMDEFLAEAPHELELIDGEIAAIAASGNSDEQPIIAERDPALLAAFEKIEAEVGARFEQPGAVIEDSARATIDSFVSGSGRLFQRPATSPAAPEPQWFYALQGKSEGPVTQSKVLAMFVRRTLPWDTLVWRAPMRDWKPAADTELRELSGLDNPPPLPGTLLRDAKSGVVPDPVCSACGGVTKSGDRFCSSCGKELLR